MDVLLILITTALAPVVASTLGALVTAAFELLILFVELGVELFLMRERQRERRQLRGLRFLRKTALVLLAVGALLLLAFETVLFDPMIRWSASRRPDTEIRFSDATGSLLTGSIVMHDVVIRRDDPARGSLDLTVQKLELDVGVLRSWSSVVPLDSVVATGVRGTYSRDLDLKRPRKNFHIDDLRVIDADVSIALEFLDREYSFPLRVSKWHCAPYRTNKAWFDVLLRSNGTGHFAGRPVTIETSGSTDQRQTRWQVERLPITALTTWIGGPLRMLTAGDVDIEIVDSWKPGTASGILSEWRFRFRDVRAAVPADAGTATKLLLTPIVKWLGDEPRQLDLEFDLRLDEDDFDRDAPDRRASMRAATATAIVRALAKKAGIDTESLGKKLDAGSRWFRGLLDRDKK